LAPQTGKVLGGVVGPIQQLTTNLYRTVATPPTLEQVAPDGKPAWTASVASLFGGPQFGPQYGWNFTTVPGLDVGSVGVAPAGDEEALDQIVTLGIHMADGTVAWRTPGAFACFGVLPVTAPYVCRYSGPGAYVGGVLSTTGSNLTLQGIDPTTGAAAWSVAVSDAQSLTTGTGVPVADAEHIVVQVNGTPELLDLRSGQTELVPKGMVFLCGKSQQVALHAPAASLSNGQRIGTSLYSPCTATGGASSARPTRAVGGAGVSVGRLFVWPSPGGLVARPVA
jgi:hypothetical protein